MLMMGIIVTVLAALIVASTSMGVNCYNQDNEQHRHKAFKEAHPLNFNYLQNMTAIGVAGIVLGLGSIAYGVKTGA